MSQPSTLQHSGGPGRSAPLEKAVFFHAGCPVCVAAEQQLAQAIDRERFEVEIVHLGEAGARLEEARAAGVVSVPALVLHGQVFHINYGAALADLG